MSRDVGARDVGEGRDGAPPAVAVVPLRDGRTGKTRLSAALGAADRGALVVALARHVVATLLASPGVAEVLVVSEDPWSARDALAGVGGPVRVVGQPPGRPGLDAAVDAARTLVLEESRARCLVVVHADLPALDPGDVAALLAPARVVPESAGVVPERAGVVLATDRAGTGTNAVVLDPVDPGFVFRFGPGSLSAHHQEAVRRGGVPTVLRRPGTACDLDTVADWWALPDPVRQRLVASVPAMGHLTLAG